MGSLHYRMRAYALLAAGRAVIDRKHPRCLLLELARVDQTRTALDASIGCATGSVRSSSTISELGRVQRPFSGELFMMI